MGGKLSRSSTSHEVAAYVATFGEAYSDYCNIILADGIDGDVIADLSDTDIDGYLHDKGITNISHKKKILSQYHAFIDRLRQPGKQSTVSRSIFSPFDFISSLFPCCRME